MAIESVQDIAEVYQPDPAQGYKVVGQDGSSLWVPNAPGNRHNGYVQEWLETNTLDEEDYAPSLAEAQLKRCEEVNSEAWRLLHPTDWYDIREAAGGTATPVNIATYRQSVRDTTNTVEADINALTTTNEVRDYAFEWPIVP
jgi:hypothetical protein